MLPLARETLASPLASPPLPGAAGALHWLARQSSIAEDLEAAVVAAVGDPATAPAAAQALLVLPNARLEPHAAELQRFLGHPDLGCRAAAASTLRRLR